MRAHNSDDDDDDDDDDDSDDDDDDKQSKTNRTQGNNICFGVNFWIQSCSAFFNFGYHLVSSFVVVVVVVVVVLLTK